MTFIERPDFFDLKNNRWCPDLTIGVAIRILDETGIDVVNRFDPSAIITDLRVLPNLIFLSVEDQAKSRGIDSVAFANLLDNDILNRAFESFITALSRFYGRDTKKKEWIQSIVTCLIEETAASYDHLSETRETFVAMIRASAKKSREALTEEAARELDQLTLGG